MVRASKIPRYQSFNQAANAFGTHARDPKLWRSYLDPELPLNLELGCGKAEVSLELACRYPEQNFIGVDLKADRLWRASKAASMNKLDNIAFIQANILELADFIPSNSVAMIWITHPDPFPKARHEKHRMLNRNFLDIYKSRLQNGGIVRFKTDNRALFDWAFELLQAQPDVRVADASYDLHAERDVADLIIETTYSKKFIALGVPICYLEFSFL
jgi:tRNA (guanine-N7-)-methyltransferase